jgi:hypothetical protein
MRRAQDLEQYVSRPVLRFHAAYLAGYLEQRDHEGLVARITVHD